MSEFEEALRRCIPLNERELDDLAAGNATVAEREAARMIKRALQSDDLDLSAFLIETVIGERLPKEFRVEAPPTWH